MLSNVRVAEFTRCYLTGGRRIHVETEDNSIEQLTSGLPVNCSTVAISKTATFWCAERKGAIRIDQNNFAEVVTNVICEV